MRQSLAFFAKKFVWVVLGGGLVLLAASSRGVGSARAQAVQAQGPEEGQALSVSDFSFEGPLGSAGAQIEKVGTNHFKVTLGAAPEHPDWPNKLNFQIEQHAKGNNLVLDVAFDGGDGYTFNEYFQSWSYDGVNWYPIRWERGYEETPQRDVLVFPTFTEDRVFVGTQVPMSYEKVEMLIDQWSASDYVRVDTVGRSLGGRGLYRLEITDPESPHPRSRRWVHYFANQHPGEHNSQWRMAGMIDWILSEEGRGFRERNISHFVLMMSPDGPSHGWYRVNEEGVDMNRSYRPAGADQEEQAHEAYLWQKDLEALMASEAPVTAIWAMHTWQGLVEPLIRPGPEMGGKLPAWTAFEEAIRRQDAQGLIEPLKERTETPSYGSVSWGAGPHEQFGITALLCEGGGNLYTKQENIDSGVTLIESISQYYRGTK